MGAAWTPSLGRTSALVGALLLVVGLLAATGALSWFGRLPGDVRVDTGSARIYVPITATILISAALTALFGLIRRLG